jgi:hypothetical protein
MLDQPKDEEMVWVSCYHEGALLGKFEVGRTWPLTHIRQEVLLQFGHDAPEDFKFTMKQPQHPDVKVNTLGSSILLF